MTSHETPQPPRPDTLWCNGEWIAPAGGAGGRTDRGWTHGLGLFETMLGVDGRLAFAEPHFIRLAEGCRRFGWEPPLPNPEMLAATAVALMARSGMTRGDVRIRLAVSGGEGSLANLTPGADRMVWMMASPATAAPDPLEVAVSPWRRNEQGALAGLKCASFAENLVALDHARRAGFGETLFLNTAGELCEAATANVFLVSGGGVRTPSLASGCLAGIARGVVLGLLRASGQACEEGRLTAADLAAADEVFLTSAVRGPMAVARVEQRALPASGVAKCLREAWRLVVRQSIQRYDPEE